MKRKWPWLARTQRSDRSRTSRRRQLLLRGSGSLDKKINLFLYHTHTHSHKEKYTYTKYKSNNEIVFVLFYIIRYIYACNTQDRKRVPIPTIQEKKRKRHPTTEVILECEGSTYKIERFRSHFSITFYNETLQHNRYIIIQHWKNKIPVFSQLK